MVRCFKAVLGLKLNLAKSILFVVGEVVNLDQLAADLGYQMGSLLFSYLGIPLGTKYKCKEETSVVERMQRKLAGWKTNYLSKGGRLRLIKSVLASSPIHLLSLLVVSGLLGTNMEQIQ